MLFSSSEVAKYINDAFEPAWESVRPAPLVTIDFGNGHTVRRTLQGNIATYVCGPDGIVCDVLPGIYAPDVYRSQLEALRKLADSICPKVGAQPDADARAVKLRDYHTQRAAALARIPPPPPPMLAIAQTGGGFKGGFGGGLGGMPFGSNLGGGGFGGGLGGGGRQFGGGFGGQLGGIEGPTERLIAGLPPASGAAVPKGPLAARPELALDSKVNEQIRRKSIHERLARAGAVRPDDIKKWLYKDVLRADLDDPMLGLGGVLNANYPFAEEDRVRAGGK